jgi:uncharacterized protein YtpQ (UPF0354 family)
MLSMKLADKLKPKLKHYQQFTFDCTREDLKVKFKEVAGDLSLSKDSLRKYLTKFY